MEILIENEENVEGETIQLCRCCQNHRDLFEESLSEIDFLLARQVIYHSEISEVSGSFGTGQIKFCFDEMTLLILHDPLSLLGFHCQVENITLPRKVVDSLRASLRESKQAFQIAGQSPQLIDIASWILIFIEEAVEHILAYRAPLLKKVNKEQGISSGPSDYYHPNFNPDSVHDTISYLVGINPKDIVESIARASEWRALRISHVEVILRNDLSRRFLLKRQEMRDDLMQVPTHLLQNVVPYEIRRAQSGHGHVKKAYVDYLVTPKLTYHGTTTSNVRSIVRHGFLKPGDIHPVTGQALGVRCGATYGRGIYSSPDPAFAMLYSSMDCVETAARDIPGLKLIVCATLMGRAATMHRADNWREFGQTRPDAESHISDNQLEYIVFDSAQILPCYVVHLDWGHKETERIKQQVRDQAAQAQMDRARSRIQQREVHNEAHFPGDKQRQKEERIAIGRKFFAYGFGPVTGNKLIIEDIAPVDDDEEDYGEYQALRVDEVANAKSFWEWEIEGQSARDQYTNERTEKRNQ
jgi:Poly(ADP-ribose) polymerase catalytic domain